MASPGLRPAGVPEPSVGKGEAEAGSAAAGLLHTDAASMPLDDGATDRQSHSVSGARERPARPPLEEVEDAVAVLGENADAVVAHGELPRRAKPAGGDGDSQIALGVGGPEGVTEEVLKDAA